MICILSLQLYIRMLQGVKLAYKTDDKLFPHTPGDRGSHDGETRGGLHGHPWRYCKFSTSTTSIEVEMISVWTWYQEENTCSYTRDLDDHTLPMWSCTTLCRCMCIIYSSVLSSVKQIGWKQKYLRCCSKDPLICYAKFKS